ncbi:MAG: hypothetical protein Q9187_003209, partial [Circinaria calcarea]
MPRRASTPYCPNLPVIMEQEDISVIEEETFPRHFSIALRDRLSSALGADDAACKLLLEEFLRWFSPSDVEIIPLENTGIYHMRKADGVTTHLIAIAGSSVGTTLANAYRGVFERMIEIIDGHDFLSASTEVTLLLLLDQSLTVVYYNPQDERVISPFPSSDRSKPHAERALPHRVKPLLKGPQLYDYARDEDDSDEDDIREDVRDGSGIFLDLKDWENHLAVRECFLFVFYPQILN